jgi:hypothetical protein
MTAAVQLAPNLKATSKGKGAPVKVVDANGKVTYVYPEDAVSQGLTPYEPPKSGSKTTNTGSYVFQNPAAFDLFKIEFPGIAERLTEGQIAGTEPLIINKSLLTNPKLPNVFKEPPVSGSGSTDFDQFTFTSPQAANKWLAANEGYTLTEDQKLGNASIILPKSMALVPANSSILELSLKPADPETVYKNFRTNYNTSPDVKKYEELKGHMDNVSTAYEQAYILEKPQVADLSMIFAYMKMLDPTSVVRESEQDQARRTGGAADWLVNYATMVGGGGSLTDEQRRSFRNGAHAFYENKTQGLASLNERFSAEATERELIERFNLYKITPKEYDLKVFGNYPGDAEIDALTGSSGLTELSVIAQYENINTNQLAKINQRIAQIKIDLGL